MAVKKVIEIHEQRNGTVTLQGDGLVKKSYTRVFLVETDLATDDAAIVLASADLPKETDVYPSDDDTVCKSRDAQPMAQQPMAWTVVVHYDNDPWINACSNPLYCPPKYSYSWQKTKEILEKDLDDKPVVNSANCPLILERDRSIPLIQIEWASINLDETDLEKYQDSLNSEAWHGHAIGCVKVEGLTAKQAQDAKFGQYYQKTLTLAINDQGWQKKLLDAGKYELLNGEILSEKPDLAGGVPPVVELQPPRLEAIRVRGQPVSEPYPLNGSGRILQIGANPVYLSFKTYKQTAVIDDIIDYPSVALPS